MQVAIDENGGRIAPTTFTFNNLFTAGPDPTTVTSGTGNEFASLLVGTPYKGIRRQRFQRCANLALRNLFAG